MKNIEQLPCRKCAELEKQIMMDTECIERLRNCALKAEDKCIELEAEFAAYKKMTALAYKGSELESRDRIEELEASPTMVAVRDAIRSEALKENEKQAERIRELETERDALAKAIADAAIKVGIINADTPLTGPHLLMLCDDMAK